MSLVVDIKKCLGDFTLSVRFAAENTRSSVPLRLRQEHDPPLHSRGGEA